MLVDDEPIITQGLNAILDWEGYGFQVVHIAENGEEALAYLKEHPIDLLITDIMMPKMTGLELIEQAQEIQEQMKSVVLSGYQDFAYVKQGVKLGIENYLLKPVDEEELIRTIQSIHEKLSTSITEVPDRTETTLKDNTLWHLLNGEIDRNDWQTRLSFYNMNTEAPFYNVSILHFEHDHELEKREQVRKYIEANYAATCLFNPDQELIIVFEYTEEDQVHLVHQSLIDQYISDQDRGIGSYYLSVGDVVQTMEQLEESYMAARSLTFYQIALEPNQLITKQIQIDTTQHLKVQQDIKSDMSKRILQSIEEISEGLTLFVTELDLKDRYISHTVARKYIIDLISYLQHSVPVEDYYKHTTSIEKLFFTTTIAEMMEILQSYCEGLFDQIHNKANTYSPIIQDVLDYMHENYDQELSLKTLSQRFYVNAIYLGQLFQKELGVVFSEYINHYRLEKAKELLKNTHLGAGEIGKRVGYSDTTYFYKQFKRNVGATPTEWRNI